MRRLFGPAIVVLVLGAILGVTIAGTAGAGVSATITVAAGQHDSITDNGACSLAEAIINANDNLATHDDCAPGVDQFDIVNIPADTINLTGDLPTIDEGMGIYGVGPALTIIDGAGTNHIFDYQGGDALEIEHLSLRNGFNDGDGGALNSGGGVLAVADVSFVGNEAAGGGAIYSDGELVLRHSEFRDNHALDGHGGAVYSDNEYLIEGVSFVSNSATDDGGALYTNSNGTVRNSTFHDNASEQGGGGWADNDNDEVFGEHLTFSANEAEQDGGQFNSGAGTVDLFATVFVDPVGDTGDCGDINVMNDNGYNVASDESCEFDASTSQDNVADPGLGPVAENGGLGQSRLPLEPGVLFDAIPTTDCDPQIDVDQRQEPRPVDGNEDGTDGCDIGAIEAQVPDPVTPPPTDPGSPPTTPGTPTTQPGGPTPSPAASPTTARPTFTG